MWAAGKEYKWKLSYCMSKYLNVVYKASKLLNMFYPSFLTNGSAGLDLELLDSLESCIQSVAKVGHLHSISTPVPSCISRGLWPHVDSSAHVAKLHLSLTISLAYACAYEQYIFLAKQGIPWENKSRSRYRPRQPLQVGVRLCQAENSRAPGACSRRARSSTFFWPWGRVIF